MGKRYGLVWKKEKTPELIQWKLVYDQVHLVAVIKDRPLVGLSQYEKSGWVIWDFVSNIWCKPEGKMTIAAVMKKTEAELEDHTRKLLYALQSKKADRKAVENLRVMRSWTRKNDKTRPNNPTTR